MMRNRVIPAIKVAIISRWVEMDLFADAHLLFLQVWCLLGILCLQNPTKLHLDEGTLTH